MTKSALQSLVSFIVDNDVTELQEVLPELQAELNKGKARKEATEKAYEEAYDVIIGNLGDTPVTCGELYEAIQNDLPEGFGRGKVQYALTHLWQDKIVKIEGKPNTYRRQW